MAEPKPVVITRVNRSRTTPLSPETLLTYLRRIEDTLRKLGIELLPEQTSVVDGGNRLTWEIHLDKHGRYALRIAVKRKTGTVEMAGEQYDKEGERTKGIAWSLGGDANVLGVIEDCEGKDDAYFQDTALNVWLPFLVALLKQP